MPVRGDLPPVAMIMEETRHYPIAGPDALDEWATSSSVGYGCTSFPPLRNLCVCNPSQMFAWAQNIAVSPWGCFMSCIAFTLCGLSSGRTTRVLSGTSSTA